MSRACTMLVTALLISSVSAAGAVASDVGPGFRQAATPRYAPSVPPYRANGAVPNERRLLEGKYSEDAHVELPNWHW
jgi:hypothetical protein